MRPLHRPLLLTLVAAAPLAAQKAAFATVTTAGAGEHVSVTLPFQRMAAYGADGQWYLIVHRRLAGDDVLAAELELWRSPGGLQWQLVGRTPTERDGNATLVAEPERKRLHVVWEARESQWTSVHHGVFDLVNSRWLGEPTVLAAGTDVDDQYYANDVCLARGRLVAAIGAHRNPRTAGFTHWSTCLRVLSGELDGGEAAWSAPRAVNVGNCGVWGDLAEDGNVVLSSFRTYTDGGHCIAARAFDVVHDAFLTTSDERIVPLPDGPLGNSNASLTAVDLLGHRYVMTTLGASEAGKGRIVIAHAPRDEPSWQTIVLADDPPLLEGNHNPRHLALARGPGNQLIAFYAKASEGHAALHLQVLDGGRVVGQEREIERGAPGTFERLCGVRQSLRRLGVQLAVSEGEASTPSRVRVYGLLR